MKVLHLCTGFPLSFNGGITNYVRALIISQRAIGYDVAVVAMEEESVDGFDVIPFSSDNVKPFSRNFDFQGASDQRILQIIEQEKPDLIHVHMVLDFSASTFECIQASGIPYCVSLHDYYYICPRIIMVKADDTVCRTMEDNKCKRCVGPVGKNKSLKRLLPSVMLDALGMLGGNVVERAEAMRCFLANAAMLFPVSKRVEEIYRDFSPDGRYHTLHIGNQSALSFPPVRERSGPIIVAALGSLTYHKGAGVLQELLARVNSSEVIFHFYGRANREWMKKLSALGLQDCGEYKPGQLGEILRNVDVGLVLPIWEDNGPQVTMEFINHRVPVVGTRRGGIPDFIGENNGYVFEPDSSTEVEGAVSFIRELDRENLLRIKEGMTPLLSPDEHAKALSLYYDEITGGVE